MCVNVFLCISVFVFVCLCLCVCLYYFLCEFVYVCVYVMLFLFVSFVCLCVHVALVCMCVCLCESLRIHFSIINSIFDNSLSFSQFICGITKTTIPPSPLSSSPNLCSNNLLDHALLFTVHED